MSKLHITTSINNEPREYLCEPNQSMLDVLRDELGLTGTKEGCGTGDCGAVYFADGRLVCACLMLGAEAQDADKKPLAWLVTLGCPLQTKFLEHAPNVESVHWIHYGVESIVEKHPNPDEATIRYWLAGNLCRCMGYDKIVRAVQDAAAEMSTRPNAHLRNRIRM